MKTTFVPVLAALLAIPAFAQEAKSPRVAVVPFAALSGDVPQRAGMKAAGMLSNELKNAEGLSLVVANRAQAADPYKDSLDEARSKVEEATEQRTQRKFTTAEQTLNQAIEAYKKAAPGLSDVGELQDAYVLLSAVQYLTGRDEDGAKTLDTALALAPTRELPLAKTSALFTKVVNDARAAVQKGAKGSLLVESSPSGAAVTVDGVALGATPLQVSEVPPGVHVWRVQLPSGESTGGVAQVAAQKQTKVAGQSSGDDPESKILAALSGNKLDAAMVEAAKAEAKTVGADLLIFGALSRDGKNLALDSFVLEAASGQVKRLPRSHFDTELLSAGMEFYNLVGSLAKEGLKVGQDTRIPGAVSTEVKSSGVKVAEVRYGEDPGKKETGLDALGLDAEGKNGPDEKVERKPLEKKRRGPLRRN